MENNKELTTFVGFDKTVVIPEGVKRILPNALTKLQYADELVLPSTLEYFTPYAVLDIETDEVFRPFIKRVSIINNDRYVTVNGALYSKDMKSLVYMPLLKKDEVLEIPEGVEETKEAACALCTGDIEYWHEDEKEIKLPKSLRKISKNAFYGVRIKSIDIPSSVTIDEGSFQKCKINERLNIGNEIIPEQCFLNDVKKVRLYDSVAEVQKYAFSSDLQKIYIPPNTKLDEEFINPGCYYIDKFNENGNFVEKVKNVFPIHTIIGGAVGSYAHKYAEKNNLKFEEVENSDEAIETFLNAEIECNLKFTGDTPF